MTRCDFCRDLVDERLSPACVAACPMRALDVTEVTEPGGDRAPDREQAMNPRSTALMANAARVRHDAAVGWSLFADQFARRRRFYDARRMKVM